MSRKRQPWGSVRKLPSGRFQARYRVDGVMRSAPTTFATKREADAFLAGTRAAVEGLRQRLLATEAGFRALPRLEGVAADADPEPAPVAFP